MSDEIIFETKKCSGCVTDKSRHSFSNTEWNKKDTYKNRLCTVCYSKQRKERIIEGPKFLGPWPHPRRRQKSI